MLKLPRFDRRWHAARRTLRFLNSGPLLALRDHPGLNEKPACVIYIILVRYCS